MRTNDNQSRMVGQPKLSETAIMKNIILRTWLLVLLVMALGANTSNAVEVAGVQLDDSIKVNDTQLVLNGAGVRTKLTAKVYVAALYVPAKSTDAESIINGTGPRRMKLVMKRDVGAKTMWGAFDEGIEANSTPDELKALQPKLARMEKAFMDLGKTAEGDVLEFDFGADGTTTFTVNGKVKENIPGKDLSTAFLKIWLGAKPAQAGLKKDLLKG
jgi:long-chain acyl-CoA synthetase